MEINNIDRIRAQEDYDATLRAGFATSTTVYELGTPVNETGVANAKKSRAQFDKLKPAVEVCMDGITLIKGENRSYHTDIDATILEMRGDGWLGTRGQPKFLPLTDRAFQRLVTLVTGKGGADYLAHCSPELRATNMNYWFPLARTTKHDKAKELAFWCRDVEPAKDKKPQPSKKEIFGTFGPRYQPFGGDQILQIAMDHLPKGARATLKYDRYRGKVYAHLHSDVKASDYVAGEVFKMVIVYEWADDGSGGISVKYGLVRNLCLNLIILNKQVINVGSIRHIGEVKDIKDTFTSYAKKATSALAWFTERWGSAVKENILDSYDTADPKVIMQGLVYNKVVWMPGVSVTDQVDRLMDSFEREPGYTRSAFINAVTRTAHEYNFENPWTQDALEETAGELLYNRVWNVYVPDEVRTEVFG